MNTNEPQNSSNSDNEPRNEGPMDERPIRTIENGQKPKSGKVNVVLALLLLLALVAAGVLGWMWKKDSVQLLHANDDIHNLSKQVEELKAAIADPSASDSKNLTGYLDPNADSAAIIEATLAYEKTKSSGVTDIEAAIVKSTSEYASVSVSSPKTGSGAMMTYLEKSEGIWVVIGDSTDDFDELVKEFGISEDIGE